MTWRAPFSCSESSKASHTERTGPPAIPQYLWTQKLQWEKTNQSKTKPLSVFQSGSQWIYLISWCQATYGRPGLISSSSFFWMSVLSIGYLQMKRESSRMTSGPRMSLTTCMIWGCLVRFLTHGYWRWMLWRLYPSPWKNTEQNIWFYVERKYEHTLNKKQHANVHLEDYKLDLQPNHIPDFQIWSYN